MCGTEQTEIATQLDNSHAEYNIYEESDKVKEHYELHRTTNIPELDQILDYTITDPKNKAEKRTYEYTTKMYCEKIRKLVENVGYGEERLVVLSQLVYVHSTQGKRILQTKTCSPLAVASIFVASKLFTSRRTLSELVLFANNCVFDIPIDKLAVMKAHKKISKLWPKISKRWEETNGTHDNSTTYVDHNMDLTRRICNSLGIDGRLTEKCARECNELAIKLLGKTPNTLVGCAIYRVLESERKSLPQDFFEQVNITRRTIESALEELH
jgi:transcription initiation factor TFIIIB Brf1 subunit/transcription initiation factor TFIIB